MKHGIKDKQAVSKTRSFAGKSRPEDNGAVKPRLGKKSLLEVAVGDLDEDGYGIAVSETHSLRISGALPGDVVIAGIDHVAQRIAFGHVKRMVRPSVCRSKKPLCRESFVCLGCPLVSMKYSEQVVWKKGFIQKYLRQYRELAELSVNEVLSPLRLTHYRTTARLAIAGKHSDPYIGIYRRATHDVFDLQECPIHHTLVNRTVKVVRDGIKKLRVPIYNPHSKMGLLRYLVVRVSEDEQKVMVVLVTSQRSYNEIHHLAKFICQQMPEIEVVAQNVNNSEGNVIMGAVDHFLTPKHHLNEKIGDVSLMLSPRSFFQVNRDGAKLIYGKVLEWAALTGRETVLDLYCGIGGISLTLAPHAAKVIGVEYVEAAVVDARNNARLNGMNNCRFEAGDAAELLEEIADEGERIDVAVLNPPRKGCDEQVLKRVSALSPQRLIYVSCSPQSLARDLNLLKTLGYSCREIQPVDMFPQTMHVENVVRLEKD